MDKEKLIQDYIANRLSDKEKAKVDAMLKTDLEFKSQFESHQDLTMAFKVSEANVLKQHFKNLDVKSSQKTSLFKRYKYAYLAIASIVIIGIFYNPFRGQSGEDLFNSNFEIYPNTYQPVVRSTQSNDTAAPFIAYENNDFATAEKGFETLLKTSENPNIRFYYALSLLNQTKLDMALKQFEIIDGKAYDYKEESLWFSALIHLNKDNFTKVKENLNQLNTLQSTFKSEERKLLLQKLKDK